MVASSIEKGPTQRLRGSLQLEKVSEVEKLPVTYVSFPTSGKGMNTDKMGKV